MRQDNEVQHEQLVSLVEKIKHISLNREDLVEVSLEYLNLYFMDNIKEKNHFISFWDNEDYIEKVCSVAREGIVLGMQAITLEEEFSFKDVIKACLDLNSHLNHFENVTDNKYEKSLLKDYLNYFRKELFIRVFKQNSNLQKETKISSAVLNQRYNLFINYKV